MPQHLCFDDDDDDADIAEAGPSSCAAPAAALEGGASAFASPSLLHPLHAVLAAPPGEYVLHLAASLDGQLVAAALSDFTARGAASLHLYHATA